MNAKFPYEPFKTHGGADVPHIKRAKSKNFTSIFTPQKVILPMLQHIGTPCKPCVNKGYKVKIGDVVGEATSYISSPIHASISGEVTSIIDIDLPNNPKIQAVVIESDGKMKVRNNLKVPSINETKDLINAIQQSGLVGLGGAGFPTHVKIDIPKNKNVETLIINIAECEPYITVDYEEVLLNADSLFSGIQTLKKALNIDRVIIAIEDNKPKAIRKLEKMCSKKQFNPDNDIWVLKLKSKYPGGAEKILVKACIGKEIPDGKLPIDVGCIIMNIATITFLSKYLKTGIPLVSRRVTIDGSAIKNPQNILVPLGTPICDVIEFCGGYKDDPQKILMGGPMMGFALVDDTLPILKQNNAILAFNKEDSILPKSTSCIRCGRCIENCPMKLMPILLEKATERQDIKSLKKLNIMTCMECGCCAYNCPASRQLVQSIRLGKSLLKDFEKR